MTWATMLVTVLHGKVIRRWRLSPETSKQKKRILEILRDLPAAILSIVSEFTSRKQDSK